MLNSFSRLWVSSLLGHTPYPEVHNDPWLVVAIFLALWRYQSQHNSLPSDIHAAKALASVSNELIASAQIQPQVLQAIPLKQLE